MYIGGSGSPFVDNCNWLDVECSGSNGLDVGGGKIDVDDRGGTGSELHGKTGEGSGGGWRGLGGPSKSTKPSFFALSTNLWRTVVR